MEIFLLKYGLLTMRYIGKIIGGFRPKLQLYTANSKSWLQKADASHEHDNLRLINLLMNFLYKHKITNLKYHLKGIK